ncbi:Ribonuclease HI [hydrothermal vent metagenome]|uniref:ribonuclease H n=1 Tax=hydrothermal vent metagenome TaxID=652676 RepID=A0A3B0RS36_9ZZZZ
MKEVVIYTDGACSGNPGPGGWGAWLVSGGHSKELTGGMAETTNNQMELTAAIEGLKSLKGPCHVTLYTDSIYVKDGITKWIHNWKKNGWRTANRKPVKNAALWQALDKQVESHNITWKWVKGHNGDPGNEKADELARQGMVDYQY